MKAIIISLTKQCVAFQNSMKERGNLLKDAIKFCEKRNAHTIDFVGIDEKQAREEINEINEFVEKFTPLIERIKQSERRAK
jgi:hypothetical protein